MKQKFELQQLYNLAEKIYSIFFHIIFLETCKSFNLIPKGLTILKEPCIGKKSEQFINQWKQMINSIEINMRDLLIEEYVKNLFMYQDLFWSKLKRDNVKDGWLFKVRKHLIYLEKTLMSKKIKKISKFSKYDEVTNIYTDRLYEHMPFFKFKFDFDSFCNSNNSDFENLFNILTLNDNVLDETSVMLPLEVSISNSDYVQISENTENINSSNESILENGRLKGRFISNNVINLSKRNLSKSEISLLSKGLKFVPTSTIIDQAKLKAELEIFGRKLRLKWYFRNNEESIQENRFKTKSKFNPRNKDAAIEIYLDSLEERLMNINISDRNYNNLSRDEREALHHLKNDDSIVIKEADKGSGVVVWDRGDYIIEANKQLSDKEIYEEVNGNLKPLESTIMKSLEKIRKRGDLPKETLDHFLISDPKLARFYLLPKIHKRLHDVPGRPVISNCGYYTENISAFLDYHIQPLAKKVPSYLKDTNDFLRKLKDFGNIDTNVLLCTMDVVGLYPNIPHDEGLSSLRKHLSLRKEKNVSTETLVELAEVVLKNNMFTFDCKTYKQKRGTAIGTKFAPPYSILFMSDLEEDFLNRFDLVPLIWWRYIDDIFFLWKHGEENLCNFIEEVNQFHPTIKFTCEWSPSSINFLDVNVKLDNGIFQTDLFVKPTDTHQFLESSSCHPFHCKKGIPYSQTLRLNRICSNNDFFDKRCNDLEWWLEQRGYSTKLVRKEVLRGRKFNREELLQDKEKSKKDGCLTFNLTYYPAFQNVKNILREIHPILTPNFEHKAVFQDIPIIGFKNNRSLKNILVHSTLRDTDKEGGSQSCHGNRCQGCVLIKETSTFSASDKSRVYNIRKGPLDCNSKYVIYLIECKVCPRKFPYVGSAKTSFRIRLNNYKSAHRKFRIISAENKSTKGIQQQKFHKHYCQEEHTGINDWEITLIDQVDNDLKFLRQRESFWQHKLHTFNQGLNEREVSLL